MQRTPCTQNTTPLNTARSTQHAAHCAALRYTMLRCAALPVCCSRAHTHTRTRVYAPRTPRTTRPGCGPGRPRWRACRSGSSRLRSARPAGQRLGPGGAAGGQTRRPAPRAPPPPPTHPAHPPSTPVHALARTRQPPAPPATHAQHPLPPPTVQRVRQLIHVRAPRHTRARRQQRGHRRRRGGGGRVRGAPQRVPKAGSAGAAGGWGGSVAAAAVAVGWGAQVEVRACAWVRGHVVQCCACLWPSMSNRSFTATRIPASGPPAAPCITASCGGGRAVQLHSQGRASTIVREAAAAATGRHASTGHCLGRHVGALQCAAHHRPGQ